MNQILIFTLFLAVFAATPQEKSATKKAPSQAATAVAFGKQTYLEYCAVCHGPDGRGTGPAASALKDPPADLTTLAKTHDGKFPDEYVSGIVRFGKPVAAHGSLDMPVWGPIFSRRENGDDAAVRRRIKNLCVFLATLQERES
jgi:mono/diheme cytochrome c family protein